MKAQACALAAVLWFGTSCHANPPIITSSSAAIGGTIVGVLNGPPDTLAGRTVTIVNVDTGQRLETTTGESGGYSLRVPPGTYRLEIELRAGEKLAEQGVVLLKNGDVAIGQTGDVKVGRQ